MRLSDLRDVIVRTPNGRALGRVHEVHCNEGRVIAIMCGPLSFIERLTARQSGRRIPWENVKKLEAGRIIVDPDPPPKASGSRSPKHTRRTSGRRSRR
jgi:sporulation protein YlmC with PRC-barrel domain